MVQLVTATSEGVTLRQEIADAGARLAAGLVDLFVLAVLSILLVLGVVALASLDPSGLSGFVGGLVIGGLVFLWIGYHVLFHRFAEGQTPGKMLLAIRVVAIDGYPPSFLALVLRGVIWPIEALFTLPLPIGLYVIAFTPRRQRLGDLVAGTVVVHARARRAPPEPWARERWSELPERTLPLSPMSLARLDARDVELLRRLVTRGSLSPEARRALFVDAARHYADRLELGPFADARIVLRELYLFARELRATSA